MLNGLFFKHNEINYTREEIDILRLIRSESIGPKTFFSLVKLFGSVSAAIENAPGCSIRGGRLRPIKIYSETEAAEELRALNKIDAKLITYKSDDYPALLKHIPDLPPLITYRGNLSIAKKNCFAIVGSRNSSINGNAFAAKIAKEMSEQGYSIVSGLARGIDTAAHHASLGSTIAVIAGGIDHIYPPENAKLYEAMASGKGLIIAESKIGSKPLSQHFPQRNRLISGLSLGVLVVEANLKSGSLITSRFALEQNREVFAVPGFPLDPRCKGTNSLLKDGAHLVESTEDILSELSNFNLQKKAFEEEIKDDNNYTHLSISNIQAVSNEMRQTVVDLLSSTPTSLTLIVEATGFPLQLIHLIILELELAGRIARMPGNMISLIY
jgi:DNA processing protein